MLGDFIVLQLHIERAHIPHDVGASLRGEADDATREVGRNVEELARWVDGDGICLAGHVMLHWEDLDGRLRRQSHQADVAVSNEEKEVGVARMKYHCTGPTCHGLEGSVEVG